MSRNVSPNHNSWFHLLRSCAFRAFVLLPCLLLLSCDYARMKEDEAINTYQMKMPEMPADSIPAAGGTKTSRLAEPKTLKNPLPFNQETIEHGQVQYRYYCVHCHGPDGRGFGRVGQSFAPLPTNLQGPTVQGMTDGEIFYNTSFGHKRHPPMVDTVAEMELWSIVQFIRSLSQPSAG
jgi:mono/diheme cytochrome c family protein